MLTVGDKVIVEPILEKPSDVIAVPDRNTRYRNGKLSICGRVTAIGPEVEGIDIGDYVYHSDSCYAPIKNSGFNVMHQGDIMFVSKELIPVQWIGAEEHFDD